MADNRFLMIRYPGEGRNFFRSSPTSELFLADSYADMNREKKTAMIRIEGIPVVAARLADAQKSEVCLAHNQRRRTSKVDAGGEGRLAIHSVLHRKMKVA